MVMYMKTAFFEICINNFLFSHFVVSHQIMFLFLFRLEMKLNSSPVGMEDKNEIIIMIEIFKRTVDCTAENISEKIHTF